MAWCLCIAVFAAFGFLCALWAFFGCLLSDSRGGVIVCDGAGLLRRVLLLRRFGLLSCPILVTGSLDEALRREIAQSEEAEICTPEDVLRCLELEREKIAGTGNGDHSRRDCRGGISEL